jgi:general secretion pathway protein A
MYEHFYGLRERPFDLTPNPRFLLMTPGHTEALSNIEYGITSKCGITLLLGEAGTGKTTVLRRALAARMETRESSLFAMYLSNPTLTRVEFMEFLAAQFELGPAAAKSKVRLLAGIEDVLRARRDTGDLTVLIIDEAQSLPNALLEEVRLLANIESETDKLLPLVLAAQPQLSIRLNTPGLQQLKQRIALRCTLAPLSLRETAQYIGGRIQLAGGDPAGAFTRDAVIAIHEHARGIPRIISVICDNALLNGFAAEQRPIGPDIIAEVCRDFDLEVPPAKTVAKAGWGRPFTAASNLRPFLPEAVRPWPPAARRPHNDCWS